MNLSCGNAPPRVLILTVLAMTLIFGTATVSFATSPSSTLVAQADTAKPETTMADQAAVPSTAEDPEGEPAPATASKPAKEGWFEKFSPILILLLVVGVVLGRLPSVEGVEHSKAFRRRRVFNWLPLGLTYAFLYMGRYNIKVSQHAFGDIDFNGAPMMTNSDFATIFFWGTAIYGSSFLLNGPLTDRLGGKFAILVGAGGAAVMNLLMGLVTQAIVHGTPLLGIESNVLASNLTTIFSALYAVNMYFQSFGAVAIVKCNAPWFHVRERGVFGAIFGILISLGIYFAFDVGYMIIESMSLENLFFIPTVLLVAFWFIDVFIVKNTPGGAGFDDFDTADASSGDEGPQLGAIAVFKLMLRNPVIIIIASIEFCSGFLRQAIMQWFRSYAKQTDAILGLKDSFVYENWGMLLCCAGIMGGVVAGIISDRVFQSRRGPVAAILYAGMLIGSIIMTFTYQTDFLPWLVILMSVCVIGVHGMLSGTASMDFGGKKNVGVAVGIIDGFVYAGTAVMSITYGIILPDDTVQSIAGNPDNWVSWPISMIPISLLGLILATRIWNAKPKSAKAS